MVLTQHAQEKLTALADQALELYVEAVRDIEVVQEVRYEIDVEGIDILTLIAAPPFEDTARFPVYDAEMSVIERIKTPFLDFRVININELPEGGEKTLHFNGDVIWKR